jgi:hypothetical protein
VYTAFRSKAVTINQKAVTMTVENPAQKIEETYFNLILILFKLRVGINHKECPAYDIVYVLILF